MAAFIRQNAALATKPHVRPAPMPMSRFRTVTLAPALAFALLFAPPAAAAVSQDPARLPAGSYTNDPAHTSVTARVRHMGVSFYVMRFDHVQAHFTYDPQAPENAQVDATVQTDSLDVGASYSRQFANQFLDAEHFPTMTFASTGLHRTGPNTGTMTGNLTMRGVTHEETFDVTFNGVGPGLIPLTTHAGFTAVGTIKRSDFGSNAWQSVVGDEVTITIEAEFAHH
jgi:polyisoprenoid-binding protein YceI